MNTITVTSESIEMYLKSIAELEALYNPVAISQLAQRLGVSSPSVIDMVKRLAGQELVVHTPYKGVTLTERGRRRAHGVLRRHRLWERFLTDRLDLPWEAVHDYACQLEHATAPDVVMALENFLGHPTRCPHGNPIPDVEGNLSDIETVALINLAIGQTAQLENITYEETILLEYLAQRGFKPGVILTLEDIAPYQGPLMIRVEGHKHPVALGREIASRIFVALKAS